jgi:hypothetical protein
VRYSCHLRPGCFSSYWRRGSRSSCYGAKSRTSRRGKGGVTTVKYEKRLRKLASRAGLCHIHLIRLVCVLCEARRGEPVWTGTDAELEELVALCDRQAPYYAQLPSAGVCPLFGCGGTRYCEPCYNAAAARVRLPDDLFSPEEWARYAVLKGYVQHQDAEAPDA